MSVARDMVREGMVPRREREGYGHKRGVRSKGGWSGGGGVTIPLTRGQTDTCENITFPQLRLRAVNIYV